MSAESVPSVIADRFQIEHEIGRGGMGAVYRARHTSLNRTVAVKILKPEFAQEPGTVERFMREARTMARLRHTGAAGIFDLGALEDGRPFMVMEYIEGRTLADLLKDGGRLGAEQAVRIACEICDVLAAAHSCGIVHRDLKPSNIMLTRTNDVRVLDFGIAKIFQCGTDAADLTRTCATTDSGMFVGTPRYMSPEQCTGDEVGPASDLYGVGVLLYEMLAGRPPFTDVLATAVLIKQATQSPAPLHGLRPDLSRALVVAVHQLLAKRPAHRPRSASDARRLLEQSVRPARREVDGAEIAPFATTVRALGDGARVTFNRLAAFALFTTMLGALGFALARGGEARYSLPTSGRTTAPAITTKDVGEANALNKNAALNASVTFDDAFAAAKRQARARAVSDVSIVQTHGGSHIVAALDGSARRGDVELFLMERRASGYRLTRRAALDTSDFRAATWHVELTDVDGDGFDEVLCTGRAGTKNTIGTQRLVLYAPAAGEFYILRIGKQTDAQTAPRLAWSPNASSANATPFRRALHARAMQPVMLAAKNN